MGHNIIEATKNICCVKGEGVVDHGAVSKWFEKFCSGYKNFNDQARLARPKVVDFKDMLQAIEANLVRSTQGVSGELSISQPSGVRHHHSIGKIIQRFRILPHITKLLLNF